MRTKLLFLLGSILITNFSFGQTVVEDVLKKMQGSFSSEEQSKTNEAFQNVNVHMYEIWNDWSDLHDEIWLYVEQAMANTPEEPYRQRVYLLKEQPDESVTVTIYEFHNARRFVGKWQDLKYFEQFDNAILSEKVGCNIILRKDGEKYVGTTNSQDCVSDWKGATYTTSEVSIGKGTFTSLDRGYDNSGKQVWGSENGPYQFVKK